MKRQAIPDPIWERRIPVMILIAVITVITFADWIHGFGAWMTVPIHVTNAWEAALSGDFSAKTLKALATTLTAGFLHGDGEHLVGNLIFIWLFGRVVVELCGWRWLVVAFLVTTVGGSIGQILLEPRSYIPSLGASGGLMGLMGFYFGLAFQKPRPDCHVWPLARPVNSNELAAAGVVSVALDFFGVLSPNQGIAYGAHIGGFVSGMILSLIADRFLRHQPS